MHPKTIKQMSEIEAKIEKFIQEHSCCVICGGTPCDWTNFSPDVIEEMEKCKRNGKSNRQMRHAGYRRFIKEKYGIVGEGNRIPCPDCVQSETRKMYPEENENDYTNFQLAHV